MTTTGTGGSTCSTSRWYEATWGRCCKCTGSPAGNGSAGPGRGAARRRAKACRRQPPPGGAALVGQGLLNDPARERGLDGGGGGGVDRVLLLTGGEVHGQRSAARGERRGEGNQVVGRGDRATCGGQLGAGGAFAGDQQLP